jgi:hypothetical protein
VTPSLFMLSNNCKNVHEALLHLSSVKKRRKKKVDLTAEEFFYPFKSNHMEIIEWASVGRSVNFFKSWIRFFSNAKL